MLLPKCILIHIFAIAIHMTSGNEACGKDRECVPKNICRNGKINTGGVSLLDIRAIDYSDVTGRSSDDKIQSPTESNSACSYPQTCCTKEVNNKTLPDIGSRFSEFERVDKPYRPAGVSPGCGFRNSDGPLTEDTNNIAKEGEFPWMVAILLEHKLSNGETAYIYQCGGSLITPKVVLTGAVCVQGRPAKNLMARVGDWKSNSNEETHPHQDRYVSDVIIHENFNPSNLHNDIAMLIFDSPFVLAPNVNTICLPQLDHDFDTSRCYVTGWGKNDYHNGQYQTTLKKIQVPVVPNAQCQDDLRKTRLSKYFELHSSFMCAGGEKDKDACKGDGGSPLVCPTENSRNRFYQAGIVAWGISCGEENVPGVYASVTQFRSWIATQLAYKDIGSEYFII